jgi:hypothetical protein
MNTTTDTTRRGFMGRLLAGGGALALPAIAMADTAQPRRRRQRSTSDTRALDAALSLYTLAAEALDMAKHDLAVPPPDGWRERYDDDDDGDREMSAEQYLRRDVNGCAIILRLFVGLITAESGQPVNASLTAELRSRAPVRLRFTDRRPFGGREFWDKVEARYWHVHLATIYLEQAEDCIGTKDTLTSTEQAADYSLCYAMSAIQCSIITVPTKGEEEFDNFLCNYIND